MEGVSQAMDSVVIAGVVSFALEQLKKAKWFPLLQDCQKKVNVTVSALIAAVAAIGIHTTYDGSTGTLVITGLTLTAVAHGGWEWVKQFFLQEFMYRTVVKEKPANGS